MDASSDTGKEASDRSLLASGIDSTGEDLIQQRINDIRMQLDDTYNIFVNAREVLSSISFENLDEHLGAATTLATLTGTAPQDFVIVRDGNNRVDLGKSIKKLETLPQALDPRRSMEDIPELGKFFQVLSDLKEGIRKINGHQQSITELNQDISTLGEPAEQPSSSGHSLASQMSNMSID